MAINKIKVSNFKSFNELEVELGSFNIVIGANASGKSNFIQIFRFLKDIAVSGLENAVSLQGGANFITNLSIDKHAPLSIESTCSFDMAQKAEINIAPKDMHYSFSLEFQGKSQRIVKDSLTFDFGSQNVVLYRGSDNSIRHEISGEEKNLLAMFGYFQEWLLKDKLIPDNIMLFQMPRAQLIFSFESIFKNIAIYDFDPKLSKKAAPIAGKAELEEDGSNLAIVLKNMIDNKGQKQKFLTLMKDILPYIFDFDIENFVDRSLLFSIREKYFKNKPIPSSLVSDGTINITALILALYFEDKPLTIIEEPERNIHPHLMSRLMEMMKDASKNKQIIVTTHNPEFIKHADLDSILLVSRDEDGFSRITRPSEKDEVKIFLQNELGIEDLFVQNMLEF